MRIVLDESDPPRLVEFLEACSIEDKKTGALIKFELWPAQSEFAQKVEDALKAEDYEGIERTLVLKARQLGWTWLILGILLYLGSFWGHRLFLIVSQSGDDAQAAIRRLKVMHDSLPEELRRERVTDNVTELEFTNGSRYETGKATKRYGRGRAAFAALCDEIAFWDWPEEQLNALDPGCTIIWAVTTGNGPGDYTHRIWRKARANLGRWKAIFHPWSARPDRDAEWYRLNVTEATEPRLARREFAATPEEAFAAPSGIFFERFDSTAGGRNVVEFVPVHNWPTVRAVDYGYHSPACAWVQTSPAGQSIVVAELSPHDLRTEEFAAEIKRVDASLDLIETPSATYCDPAGKGVDPQTAESEVEVFRRAGLRPASKASGVRDGCVRLISLIGDPDLPLLISTACPWTIEALGGVRPDKHRPDVYDEDSEYDHILDALRYWAVNRSTGTTYVAPKRGRTITSGMRDHIW